MLQRRVPRHDTTWRGSQQLGRPRDDRLFWLCGRRPGRHRSRVRGDRAARRWRRRSSPSGHTRAGPQHARTVDRLQRLRTARRALLTSPAYRATALKDRVERMGHVFQGNVRQCNSFVAGLQDPAGSGPIMDVRNPDAHDQLLSEADAPEAYGAVITRPVAAPARSRRADRGRRHGMRDGARAERGGGSGRAVGVLHGGRERLGALLRRRRVHPHDLPAVAVEVEEAA